MEASGQVRAPASFIFSETVACAPWVGTRRLIKIWKAVLEDEIKDMSNSVGTWKLRVAYLIWLISEDVLSVSFTASHWNEDIETTAERGGIKKPKQEKKIQVQSTIVPLMTW